MIAEENKRLWAQNIRFAFICSSQKITASLSSIYPLRRAWNEHNEIAKATKSKIMSAPHITATMYFYFSFGVTLSSRKRYKQINIRTDLRMFFLRCHQSRWEIHKLNKRRRERKKTTCVIPLCVAWRLSCGRYYVIESAIRWDSDSDSERKIEKRSECKRLIV